MRGGIVLAIIAMALASISKADAAECRGSLTRPAFNLQVEKAELDRRANMIQVDWVTNQSKMSPQDALQHRVLDIQQLYADIGNTRREIYSGATCSVISSKKCASTPGKKHYCPMSIAPPANTAYDMSSLTVDGKDFDSWPALSGGDIAYTVKKTGAGSNTAGFHANVRFRSDVVDRWVQEDVTLAKEYLSPAFKIDSIAGAVHVADGSAPSGTCASLGTELGKLKELRDQGALTPEQFKKATDALIAKCS